MFFLSYFTQVLDEGLFVFLIKPIEIDVLICGHALQLMMCLGGAA